MLQFFDTLTDDSGNSLLGATVTVTNYPSGTLATIYSTNGTASPIANSVVAADITGQVSFYIPDGAYTLTYAYKSTIYKTRSPVQMLDPMGFVAAADTGGSANTYAVSGAQYPATLYTGLKVEIKAANTNTGASTLNFQSLGAQAINQPGGSALAAGMIQANGLARVEWDGTQWQLLGSQSQPFYAITGPETTAGVTVTNNTVAPGNLIRYGADPTGASDSTTAVRAWVKLINSYPLYAPNGTYKTDTVTITSTGVRFRIYGDGRGQTIFKPLTTNDVFTFATSTPLQQFTMENFEIAGAASGSGNGIKIPTGLSFNPYDCTFRNLFIHDCGGAGILDLMGMFDSEIDHVLIDNCLGNQFDLLGSNTLTLKNCYAMRCPTSGKAGYRIHSGDVTMISCNGINPVCQIAYLFGDTVAEDGVLHYCFPTLINCHAEDFSLIGYRNKNNGCKFIGTDAVAPVSGTVIGYKCDSANTAGTIDDINLLSGTKGASFSNSQAIHTTANAPPFLFAGNSNGTSYSYYNETDTNTYTVGCFQTGYAAFLKQAQAVGDFWGKGLVQTTQLVQKRTAPTFGASISIDASLGNRFDIVATSATAPTINVPTNALDGQKITFWFSNTSGGAMGATSFSGSAGGYKLVGGAFTNPANGFNRSITFQYDSLNSFWYELYRSSGDVAN